MRRWVLLFLVLSLTTIGCSSEVARLPVVRLTGSATFQNAPAAGAMLVFHPQGGESLTRQLRPLATVQNDGSFTAYTYDYGDGLPTGDYAITVHWFRAGGDNEGDTQTSRIAAKYAKPETSGLKATITSGDNTLSPIVLTR